MSQSDITGLIEFLPEELASFFEGASYSQSPEFHSKRRELRLYLDLKAPLPYEAYERMIHTLRLHFHASVDVTIRAEKARSPLTSWHAISAISSKRKRVCSVSGISIQAKGNSPIRSRQPTSRRLPR